MRLVARRKRERQRAAVLDGLYALRREFTSQVDRGCIDDMILYAEVGRDRYKLDESWVQRTRDQLENPLWRAAQSAALTENATSPGGRPGEGTPP